MVEVRWMVVVVVVEVVLLVVERSGKTATARSDKKSRAKRKDSKRGSFRAIGEFGPTSSGEDFQRRRRKDPNETQ